MRGIRWSTVPIAGRILKRLLVGRPLGSDRLEHTLLPKRIALPVFASDALSSVGYAPDEIFLTLSVAGLGAYAFSWKIGLAVAAVMLVVVASYRQNVHAYPSGGGDYEVATTNLGPSAGLTVASALLVDYVLTVAVSISSAAQYGAAAIPALRGHEATAAVLAVAVLTAVNLRGVRESGTAFAVPTYVFMLSIIGMGLWGFGRMLFGDLPDVDPRHHGTGELEELQGARVGAPGKGAHVSGGHQGLKRAVDVALRQAQRARQFADAAGRLAARQVLQ